HLTLPIGPIVPAVGTPVVERMRNAARAQDLGEPPRGHTVFVGPVAGGQVDVALPQVVQEVPVREVRHVVHGVVEVEVVVVVAVHEAPDVVDAGQGQAAAELV